MFILCHAAKNEPRKRARTFPPGPPLAADGGLRRRGVCVGKSFCYLVGADSISARLCGVFPLSRAAREVGPYDVCAKFVQNLR